MNVFELAAKLTLDTSDFDKGLSAVGGKLKKAGKTIGIALGAASAAVTGLTKQAVTAYAEYEQLTGGTALMLGDAYDSVIERSQNAYKTVQMSQNDYLTQVNRFATGLKNSMGGSEQAAADLSHRILLAEADIVAAVGVSQETVQTAFNAVMRNNYTMLDNLGIGIRGTKQGMEDVIKIVNEWNAEQGKATNYQMDNYADMQNALIDYVEMVGLAGYAQMEAENTIQGSVASMKAAWQNLLVALSAGGGFKQQMDALVESARTAFNNILPIVENFLVGFAELMKQVGPMIVEKLPEIIQNVVPSVLDAAVQIVGALVDALPGILQAIVTVFGGLVDSIKAYLTERWPELGETFDSIAEFAKTAFNNIISFIQKVFSGDWQGAWEDLKNLAMSIDWASVGTSIMTFVANAWNGLKKWASEKWDKAVDGISSVDWKRAGEVAKTWIGAAWSTLREWAGKLWENAKKGIQDVNWAEIGGKVKDAISTAWNALKGWATGIWKNAKTGIENVPWKETGEFIMSKVSAGAASLVDTMKTVFAGAGLLVRTINWVDLGSWIADTIWSGFESIGKWFYDHFLSEKNETQNGIDWWGLGVNIISSICDGLVAAQDFIWGFFKELAKNIAIDFIKGLAWNLEENLGLHKPNMLNMWEGFGEVSKDAILAGMDPIKAETLRLAEESASNFGGGGNASRGSGAGRGIWHDAGETAKNGILRLMETLPKDVGTLGENAANRFGGGGSATRGSGAGRSVWHDAGEKAKSEVVTVMNALTGEITEIGVQSASGFGVGRSSVVGSTAGTGVGRENIWSRTADTIRGFLRDGISHITTDISSTADKAASNFGGASGGGGSSNRWSGAGRNAGNSVSEAFKTAALNAKEAINELQNAINNIKGKTVSINIQQKVTTTNAGAANTKDRNGKISPNARAMDTGYIFRHPTVFAYADNAFQVAGDVGAEAVVGVYSLDKMIQNSVNAAVGRTQAAMVGVLSEILDKMPKGQLVLDTGALVGGIAPEMNNELERITAWSGGGRA